VKQKHIVRKKIKFDRDWYFQKGDIPIPYAVKAGMTGGLTDCKQTEEGEWLNIAFSYKTQSVNQVPEDWEQVNLPHDWLVEELFSKDGPVERGFKK
jgi:beta-galactosidase